jgi:hypothetical protein
MKRSANNTGLGQNDKQTYIVEVSAKARALEHRESVTQTVCFSEDLMIFGQLTRLHSPHILQNKLHTTVKHLDG